MFGGNHYVPLLKSKPGERDALAQLAPAAKSGLTPLIEVDSVPEDLDTGDPNRSLDRHCTLNIDPLAAAWGTTDRIFLDPIWVATLQSTTNQPGAEYVYQQAQAAGLQFVPVCGLRRGATELTAASNHNARGVCLRIDEVDMASASLANDVNSFLGAVSKAATEVDLVLDLGVVYGSTVPRILGVARAYLTLLPLLTQWRTVTLASCAFPANMAGIPSNGTTTIERTDWLTWQQLHAQRSGLARLPTFGDYAIQHPVPLEGFDPRYMASSANIRYTLDDSWLVLKGSSLRRTPGSNQYSALATALIARQEFMQAGHCVGCHDITQCAGGAPLMANPTAWRRIGTVHHLSHVRLQIGRLAWP